MESLDMTIGKESINTFTESAFIFEESGKTGMVSRNIPVVLYEPINTLEGINSLIVPDTGVVLPEEIKEIKQNETVASKPKTLRNNFL